MIMINGLSGQGFIEVNFKKVFFLTDRVANVS